MNAYAVIAGLSGIAVFCAVALKGFGKSRSGSLFPFPT